MGGNVSLISGHVDENTNYEVLKKKNIVDTAHFMAKIIVDQETTHMLDSDITATYLVALHRAAFNKCLWWLSREADGDDFSGGLFISE